MTAELATIAEGVRAALAGHGGLTRDLEQLGDADDLYAAGMTSFASVNVMLEIEDSFEVEFPDRLLKRSIFSSVESISRAVGEMLVDGDS